MKIQILSNHITASHPLLIHAPAGGATLLLAWIRQYQPELMMNSDKRENAMRFEVEIQNNETCDIEIKLPLTERVKVWKDEQGLHFEHLPEPPEDPYDGITWELFINGEYQPWPPTSTV